MYMKIRTQVPQPGFRSSIYGLLPGASFVIQISSRLGFVIVIL